MDFKQKKILFRKRSAVKAFTPWLSRTFRVVNKNYTVILYLYFYTKNEKNNCKTIAADITDSYNSCSVVCSALRLI